MSGGDVAVDAQVLQLRQLDAEHVQCLQDAYALEQPDIPWPEYLQQRGLFETRRLDRRRFGVPVPAASKRPRLVPLASGPGRCPEGPSSEALFFHQHCLEAKYIPLYRFLQTAAKYVPTADWLLAWDEMRLISILDRVAGLKKENGWSGRRPKRPAEVERPRTVRDAMLEEMRWMATDFAEERRWKRAMSRKIAEEAARRQRGAGRGADGFYRQSLVLAADEIQVLTPRTLACPPSPESVHSALERLCNRTFTLSDLRHAAIGQVDPATVVPAMELPLSAHLLPSMVPWHREEDQELHSLFLLFGAANLDLLARALNNAAHHGQPVRRPFDCAQRLVTADPSARPRDAREAARLHASRFETMRGFRSKLTLPVASMVAQSGARRSGMAVHSSHEQAIMKATANVSRLPTPADLATQRANRAMMVLHHHQQQRQQAVLGQPPQPPRPMMARPMAPSTQPAPPPGMVPIRPPGVGGQPAGLSGVQVTTMSVLAGTGHAVAAPRPSVPRPSSGSTNPAMTSPSSMTIAAVIQQQQRQMAMAARQRPTPTQQQQPTVPKNIRPASPAPRR